MNANEYRHFRVERDERDVVTVTIDVASRPVNVFDAEVLAELEAIVSSCETAGDARVVVFRSGKASGFLAGADVKQIARLDNPGDVDEVIARGQALFNRIEALPMPTVAVIHGPCLGGGLEFALACRYRIARNDAATRLGLPEIKLGLVPAWGGTQRLPRLIGLVPALSMILQGSQIPAGKALKQGLVDLAPTPDEFDDAVEGFVARLAKEGAVSAPRRSSFSAWLINRTRIGRWLAFRATSRRIASQARNYPALDEALAAVRVGLTQSMSAGLDREREAFGRLLFTPTCRNLLGLFFQRERARNVTTWLADRGRDSQIEPDSVSPVNIQRIGVVGAGAMGAGIAQLAAYQGLGVVLREIDRQPLDAGMARIRELFDDAVSGRRLSRSEADERLAAIVPTIDWEPLSDVDLVVEAVVERKDIKAQVFGELERTVPESALLASNTSSLSINELSEALSRPERLAGLHFFNPVHRMELVEVVRTPATTDAVIEPLVRLVRKLGKTPVVVNDSPGFLVNRILFPYLAEAVLMVREGAGVESIDRTMKKFGMPMGPLELLDQVGLDVAAHVANSLAPVTADAGGTAEHLAQMVEQGRLGKKSGRGFYEYTGGRKRALDDGSAKPASGAQASGGRKPPVASGDIQQRLVLSLVNEAARCLEEGVAEAAWMVDLAMVLGTGFAPFRGGPLRLADETGTSRIVDDLHALQKQHGERFAPCRLLTELAGRNAAFHESKPKEPASDPARAAV